MNLLNRAIFAIRHAMTNEESRYAVGHMKIKGNEAHTTNGTIALQVQINGLDNDCFPDQAPGLTAIKPLDEDVDEIRLSKQTADKLFKALPKNGFIPALRNAYVGQDGDKPVVAVTDLESSQVFRTEENVGAFPDLDALKKDYPKARVCVDAYYLNELCKVLRDFHGLKQGESPVILELWDKNDAVVMSARNDEGQKLRAYLMPMTFDDKEFLFRTPGELKAEAEREAKETAEAEALKKAEAEAPNPHEQVSTYIVPHDVPEGTEIIAEEDKEGNRCRYCGEIPQDCECSRGETDDEDPDTTHLDEKPDDDEAE